MSKKYRRYTLAEYLDTLSMKTPVPGGGSAAALTAALGVALIAMAANYSRGKNESSAARRAIDNILKKSHQMRKRLLALVDRDAEAYLGVVKTRRASDRLKKAALKKACEVPFEVCRLCYRAVNLTPFLIKNGNPNLLSDVEIANELLLAAFQSSQINVAINAC